MEIGLQQEVFTNLCAFRDGKDWKSLNSLIDSLTQPENAAQAYDRLRQLLAEQDLGLLACYLEAAARVHDRYRTMGIPDEIYYDTMACFSRFLMETRRRTGSWCFDRGFWTYRQTSMALFRIGALELELRRDHREISLHIPSDACFTPASVDASLARCWDFLRRYYPDCTSFSITCHSWLLSPELGKLLPPDSHIRAFQQRFCLVSVEPESREFMQWLFDAPADACLEDLPEDTSLRRSVKAHLRRGGLIGEAKGILKENEYLVKGV